MPRTFRDLFVSFMPRAIILLLCTKTHPTGVSSDSRAFSAYDGEHEISVSMTGDLQYHI